MCKKVWLSIVVFLAFSTLNADPQPPSKSNIEEQNKWVDSIFNSMSEDERIGQLFIISTYSNKNREYVEAIEKIIKEHKIGALLFLNSSPVAQANLTNHYQNLSKTPLLVGLHPADTSNDSIPQVPNILTLAAASDEKAVFERGKAASAQLRRLGLHMTFTSSDQISLLEEAGLKSTLSLKNGAYQKGLKEGKVISNALIYPPLEIETESADGSISKSSDPSKDNMGKIMIGQSSSDIEDKSHLISINPGALRETLRKELEAEALFFLKDINSKNLSNTIKADEINLKSLISENDVLFLTADVQKAIKKIKSAIKAKEIKSSDVEKAVKRILLVKYNAGLAKATPIVTQNLYGDLHSGKLNAKHINLHSKAITLVENKNNLIPFRALDSLSFASVSIGIDLKNEFQQMLNNYAFFSKYTIFNKYSSDTVFNNILKKVINHKIVVVALHGLSGTEGNNYGISPNTLTFIEKLKEKTQVVIVAFGNPLCFNLVGDNASLITTYEDNKHTRQLVPQILFGAIKAEGTLPISISSKYKAGHGIKSESLGRLKYNVPESVGIDGATLSNIDKIAFEAIKKHSTPGCQVLIAKSGTVIFQKSYGFIAYDSIQPVTDETIYDIASITKVVATVQVLMFLEERGLLDLSKKLSDYLPELKNTNKANIIIRDVLIHQAGLTPFIPHWTKTLSFGEHDKNFYSAQKSDRYSIEVAKGMYGISSLPDSVWKWTIQSELLRKKKNQVNYEYKYSDVGYFFLMRIAEKLLNQPMDDFLQQNFYSPLGASTLTYTPLKRFSDGIIAPTEDDKSFRRQLIRGYVHDQGAALIGGVAGHAGLFSSATDLAKILQMNLNGGAYAGHRYLTSTTLQKFTKRQVPNNRRGLGWDKPEIINDGQTSPHASSKTYGHTGFSGTCAWVDPDKEIVYIFLSNRIYPNAGNNTLLKEGIRARIQEEIYKGIINYNTAHNIQ